MNNMLSVQNENQRIMPVTLDATEDRIKAKIQLCKTNLGSELNTYFKAYTALSEEEKMAKWSQLRKKCKKFHKKLSTCKTNEKAMNLINQCGIMSIAREIELYNKYFSEHSKLQELIIFEQYIKEHSNISIEDNVIELTTLDKQLQQRREKTQEIYAITQNSNLMDDNTKCNNASDMRTVIIKWYEEMQNHPNAPFNTSYQARVIDMAKQLSSDCAQQYQRNEVLKTMGAINLVYDDYTEEFTALGNSLSDIAAMARTQLQVLHSVKHPQLEQETRDKFALYNNSLPM